MLVEHGAGKVSGPLTAHPGACGEGIKGMGTGSSQHGLVGGGASHHGRAPADPSTRRSPLRPWGAHAGAGESVRGTEQPRETGLDLPMAKDWNIAITEKNEAPVELSRVELKTLKNLVLPQGDRELVMHRKEKRLGWRLNHFPGQPVPTPDNPFSEVKFPNIQSKPPRVQLEAISSHPITCYLGEETDTHLSTTSFQGPVSSYCNPGPKKCPVLGQSKGNRLLTCPYPVTKVQGRSNKGSDRKDIQTNLSKLFHSEHQDERQTASEVELQKAEQGKLEDHCILKVRTAKPDESSHQSCWQLLQQFWQPNVEPASSAKKSSQEDSYSPIYRCWKKRIPELGVCAPMLAKHTLGVATHVLTFTAEKQNENRRAIVL
ncbi:hypothetical protein QYF61_010857, partial [Mycteria americana]